jgi:hypothetical protein
MTRTTKEKANTMVRDARCGRLIGHRAAAFGMAALSAATVLGLTSVAGAAPARPGGGASGSVASVSGSTMEVQSTSAQTSVSWTATTTFSETATETISDVTAGDCVTVTGTPAKKSKTTIAARSVTISKPSTSGACTAGARAGAGFGGAGGGQGRFGAGGAGSGGTPPQGSFPGRGSGGGSAGGRPSFGGGANLAVATGKVTAVNGSTMSVSGTLLNQLFNRAATKSKSKTAKKPAALKTQNLKVTTGKSTVLSETVSATSAALAVGDCVSAFGTPSTTGAVKATTVRITSTGGKTCSSGFGGFGGGFAGGGQGGASGA